MWRGFWFLNSMLVSNSSFFWGVICWFVLVLCCVICCIQQEEQSISPIARSQFHLMKYHPHWQLLEKWKSKMIIASILTVIFVGTWILLVRAYPMLFSWELNIPKLMVVEDIGGANSHGFLLTFYLYFFLWFKEDEFLWISN